MDQAGYQSKIRNLAVPAVYLMLRGSDDSILLMLRSGTGYMDGMWDLPSGHIEPGELPTQAMVRETKEEVGVVIIREDLTLVHTSYRPKHDKTGDRADYVFQSQKWLGQPEIGEPDKCEKLGWFRSGTLPKNIVPHVRVFIQLWRDGVNFSELDLDWLKANGEYHP